MRMYRFKTWFFMTVLSTLLLVAGHLLAGRQGLLLAFVFALAINVLSYFYSQPMVLWTYRARPLEGADFYGLNKMVKDLAMQIGLPKPRIFIIPTPTPNAFAMGQSPEIHPLFLLREY